MRRFFRSVSFCAAVLILAAVCVAQTASPANPAQQKYLAEKDSLNARASEFLSRNHDTLYGQSEDAFVSKIDSLRHEFTSHLDSFAAFYMDSGREFIQTERLDIHYSFDAYLLGYPYWHERDSGQRVELSPATQKRLNQNLADFNKPELLTNESFRAYVDGFLYFKSNLERAKPECQNTDNQKLTALFRIIPEYFSNPACRDFWSFKYLSYHIENLGIKNIDPMVKQFEATCTDTSLSNKIDAQYDEERKGLAGHVIRSYKSVGNVDLDLHLFLPDSVLEGKKRPVYVFFHGGAWTEGKPDWGFWACESRAKSGWVAVAVEYRVNDREGTLPFEAVKDARSAIRWLRQHAADYNMDTNRIVATGNSAGGHLVLCTALADQWNDSDDLNYSATPNLLMVNSGVFDLTDQSWITKDWKDKSVVRQISPNYLVRKGMPPTLIIHGTNDRNVPFQTAKVFEAKMTEAHNDFEFHSLEGSGHFFWYDEKFSKQVSQIRQEFLKKHGY